MGQHKESRRAWPPQFKARLAEQLLRGQAKVDELSAEHGINPSVLHRWREEFLQRGADVAAQQQRQELEAEARRFKRRADKLQRQVDFLAGALGDKADPSAR